MLGYLKIAVLVLAACGASRAQAESANPWPVTESRVTFLTAGNQDFWPWFSPDGSQILFSRRVGGTWELLLVPVAGGEPRKLAQSPLPVSATRANWSKRNNLIAFTGTSSDDRSTIWVIKPDGSGAHDVSIRGLSNQVVYPSWYPDGEQLAAMDAQDMAIKRIDLSRSVAVTLTDNKRVLTGMPSVSPDGKWIAFAGQENKGQQYDQSRNSLWLVDEGGAARNVESNPSQGRAPTWSPSGKQLAFESTRASTAGLYAIFIINRDGTGLIQVTNPTLNADHPVWSPDGRQLAFSAHDAARGIGRSIGIIVLNASAAPTSMSGRSLPHRRSQWR
jgi:Tol biopolymer transport system component